VFFIASARTRKVSAASLHRLPAEAVYFSRLFFDFLVRLGHNFTKAGYFDTDAPQKLLGLLGL
jgi:hypothetical protein